MGKHPSLNRQYGNYIIMFDFDGTLTRGGVPLQPTLAKLLISSCIDAGCIITTNTNRPLARPPEMLWSLKYPFSSYYGNARSWLGFPRIGFFRDWLLGEEYISKVENMRQASLYHGRTPILIDDNANTVRRVREKGWIAFHVGPCGIDQELIRRVRAIVDPLP